MALYNSSVCAFHTSSKIEESRGCYFCFSFFFFVRIPGDLLISADVLYNYLEANNKVPWEDLRYLFGEIMYGGHITDDWDRRLCRTYLEEYLQPEVASLPQLFIFFP